jgi:predicted ferric reductase
VTGVVGAASLLVVVALWVSNRGLQDLADASTSLISLGRITGLVAADLLLIQVFLMARVPWLENSWGRDRLTRWHRLTGFTSLNLMLAHVLLVCLGYAVASGTGVIAQTWNLVTTYPGMLLATAATVALIAVAVTSVRAARRRLRYESWHLLHLYAYLGAGLALPHQLWTGTDFLASTAATVYWWTAYAIAAGAVLTYRIITPIRRTLRHALVVHAVVPEAPGVVSIWLRGTRLDELNAHAGQFFLWRFRSGPGWTRAHPYSLSAPPQADLLRITVKDNGDDSRALRRLRPGTRALIEGPYGTLTADTDWRSRVTMIASGVGITPLRALLETLPYRPGGATLIYRARTQADYLFRTELDTLTRQRGLRVHYLTGPRAAPGRWTPTGHHNDDDTLHHLVPTIATHDVFICGPDEWMTAAATSARNAGVPPHNLHLEHFTW